MHQLVPQDVACDPNCHPYQLVKRFTTKSVPWKHVDYSINGILLTVLKGENRILPATWKIIAGLEKVTKWPVMASLTTICHGIPTACMTSAYTMDPVDKQKLLASGYGGGGQILSIERHWEDITLSLTVRKSALTHSRVERTINTHLDSECPGRRDRRPSC